MSEERDYTLIKVDNTLDSNNHSKDPSDNSQITDPNENAPPPQEIPPESKPDLASLAGLEHDDNEGLLIDQEYRLDSDTDERSSGRNISNSPIARTGLVGSAIGVIVLLTLLTMTFFRGDRNQFAGNSETPSTVSDQSDDAEADRLRSRLALVDQQRSAHISDADIPPAPPPRNEQDPEEPPPKPEKPQPPPAPPATVRRSPPPAPEAPAPEPIPNPPRIPSQPLAESEPLVNPLQRWERLAIAGSQGSQTAFAPPVKVPETSVEVGDAATDEAATPQLQTQPDSKAQPMLFVDSDGQRLALTLPSTNASDLTIPSETLGDNPYSGPGKPVESWSTSLTQTKNESSPGELGILQRRQVPEDIPTSIPDSQLPSGPGKPVESWSTSSTQTKNEFSPGELGILQRRQVPEDIPTSIPDSQLPIRFDVALGTTVAGEIQVPIVASPNGETFGRFSVVLTSPMMSIDGQIALPQGTVLITQVQAINNNSRAIQQTVVAAVYRDRTGQLRQEEIAPNILIIRGDEGGPLIAKIKNANSSFFQDLMVGAFGAARNVGAIANRPNIATSSSVSNGSSSTSTTVETASDPDLVAAALQGFFEETAERMQQRFRNTTQPTPVLFVKSRKKVQVFANGLLSVLR